MSVNQGIRTSVPEKLEKRGTHDASYQVGERGPLNGEGAEKFKGWLSPWRRT